MSTVPRLTLRLIQVPAPHDSATSSFVTSHGRTSTRGILIQLPPTLNALKTVTMEYARQNAHMKALMQTCKTRRKAERAQYHATKRQKKRSTITETKQQHDDAMNDGEEKDGEDSEDDNPAQLPSFWPFSWRYAIDGGAITTPDEYALLVRDRDCVDAELLVHEAHGKQWIEAMDYCKGMIDDPNIAASTLQKSDEPALHIASSPASNPHVMMPSAHRASTAADADTTMTPAPPAANTTITTATSSSTLHRNGRALASTALPTPSTNSTPQPQQKHQQQASRSSQTTNQSSGGKATATAAAPKIIDGKTTFPCCSTGCTNPATLGPCPHCFAIGHKTAFFCSQDCYSKNWKLHSAQYHPTTA